MKNKIILLIIFININLLFSQNSFITIVEIVNEKSNPNRGLIENNISSLLNYFNNAFSKDATTLDLSANIVTTNGMESINKLWKNRQFKTNELELYVYLLNRNNNTSYEIRHIPLVQLDDEGKSNYQEAVFTLTKDGKIDDLKFGVAEHQYKEIMKRGLSAIEETRRLVILSFVENFRTAYDRKDIKYIESVFGDKALIIVGKVIKEENSRIGLDGNVEVEKVKFIRLSKQEYIKNLTSTFKSNNYIKVKYDSIEVTQSKMNDHFYAVNMIQDWKTTRYSDKGYLFLLIDFTDEDKPIIHVRAWEPHKQTIKKDRIVIGDFVIEPPE